MFCFLIGKVKFPLSNVRENFRTEDAAGYRILLACGKFYTKIRVGNCE
jgi:hypothetical protein